jgi:hypothetical protein
MKKRIISMTLASSLILPSILVASSTNYSVAVEMARAEKADKLVAKVNDLYDYVLLYIYKTGDLTPTINEVNLYTGLDSSAWKNFNGDALTLIFNDNSLEIGNLFSSTPTSETLNYLKNSANLTSLSSVDTSTFKWKKIFSTQVLKFKRLTAELLENTSIVISESSPSNTSKTWYQPDGNGNYAIYKYNSGTAKWVEIGSSGADGNSSMQAETEEELLQTPCLSNDKGYVVGENIGAEYICSSNEEWIKVSNAEDKIYTYSNIEDIIQNHMSDAKGSIISGVSIPSTLDIVEFTKYSNYWATTSGKYFVAESKSLLPLTVQNGTQAWITDSGLFYKYDGLTNDWVAYIKNTNNFLTSFEFFSDQDKIYIEDEGDIFTYHEDAVLISANSKRVGYSRGTSTYQHIPPENLGLEEGAYVADLLANKAYAMKVVNEPYLNPDGAPRLQYQNNTDGLFLVFATNIINPMKKTYGFPYVTLLREDNERFWLIANQVFSNYKEGTQKILYSSISHGTRIDNVLGGGNIPLAQSGQKLYGDRDGKASYYNTIIEYQGQADGTWTSTISGNGLVDYTFTSLDEMYGDTSSYTNNQTALIKNTYVDWISATKMWGQHSYWYNGIINIPYSNQYQTGNSSIEWEGVTSDGKYYYSKIQPSATYEKASMVCGKYKGLYNPIIYTIIPPYEITTVSGGEISASGTDYIWTQKVDVAGTRVVINGNNKKNASELEAYPFRCVVAYAGGKF